MPMIEAALQRFTRAELLRKLRAAHIPCGEVCGLLEALQSERTHEAGLLHHFDDARGRPPSRAGPALRHGRPAPARAPPAAPSGASTPTRCCTSCWAWPPRPWPHCSQQQVI